LNQYVQRSHRAAELNELPLTERHDRGVPWEDRSAPSIPLGGLTRGRHTKAPRDKSQNKHYEIDIYCWRLLDKGGADKEWRNPRNWWLRNVDGCFS
jgi:hypothetical protein